VTNLGHPVEQHKQLELQTCSVVQSENCVIFEIDRQALKELIQTQKKY
jgi:hypothetical protein